MTRRFKMGLVALAMTGALVGGGAATALAQTGSSDGSTSTTTPSTSTAPAAPAAPMPHSGANCPNM
jgi:hypothetical protein